jgi:hypothetical protein
MLMASGLWAAPLPENQSWIEQIDGGFIFPMSSAASGDYDRGVGGDILVGYRFDRTFSLSADLGYYDCDQKLIGATAGEWIYVPMLAVARWTFGDGTVRPYVFAGAGIAVNSYNLTQGVWGHITNKETDLLLAPGAGVLFIVAPGTALYLQARMDLNFTTQNGPWTDNPSIFLPIKGGLSFFVL